jgi:hypothetical protein
MRAKEGIGAILLFVCLIAPSLGAGLAIERTGEVSKTQPPQYARSTFHWVTQRQDPLLWSKVKAAFRQELSPGTYAAHDIVYKYRYLLRIGAYRDSTLVLIGYRTDKNDPPEFDYFLAFTYDLRTSRKSQVTSPNGFWYWRLVGLAQIDRSPIPDVVFTHDDCIECEAKHRLSSFSFSPRDQEWKLRVWPQDGTDLLIGGASKDEPQEIYEYICLYAIRDFNGDRLKDVAIWCRERATIRGTEEDSVALYTTQGDTPTRVAPTGALLASIKRALCMKTPRSPLCAARK